MMLCSDVVMHTDIPQTDEPSPVSNASFGEDQVSRRSRCYYRDNRVEGVRSGAGVGFNGPARQGSGIGTQFSQGTGASEVGLEVPNHIDAGSGTFTTKALPGLGIFYDRSVARTRIRWRGLCSRRSYHQDAQF